MQTYHLTMDDGTRLDIQADSAARAIRRALEEHLNHSVSACFTGGILQEKSYAGRMDYVIPPHHPLTAYNVRKQREADGEQVTMFADYNLKEESLIAKGRAKHDREQAELKMRLKSRDAQDNAQ